MQIPIGIIGIIELLAAIWVTNKIKNRYIVIVILSLPPIGACCGLVYMSRSNIGGLMACYHVTHTYPCLREVTVYFRARIRLTFVQQSPSCMRGPTSTPRVRQSA
jgi:hypothetical protein